MGATESFVDINFWTSLFTLLNFAALFIVLTKFLYKPVMDIIHKRQQEIDDMYTQANSAKENAEALEAQYKKELSVAAATSERMVKEAVARGQEKEAQIIAQAQKDADAIMAKASRDIALEKKKAVSGAKEEISDIAIVLAEKVIGKSLKAADRQDLVDSFIDELGDTP